MSRFTVLGRRSFGTEQKHGLVVHGRLVRTPAFQAEEPGSTPGGAIFFKDL